MNWWSAPSLCATAIGVVGILVWRLVPANRSGARLIARFVFFVGVSAPLFGHGTPPFETVTIEAVDAQTLLRGAAKLLWWLHLAWALIGFVQIFLFIERKPREARLFREIVVGIIYTGAGLSILAYVFGVPIAPMIATSGVFAIVLGMALQNTLSDLFAGIALDLGRPYDLGDWIVLGDGTEGRVTETNWQSTHLTSLTGNTVALPNSFLAKLPVTNVSRPDESHGLSVTIRFVPTIAPSVMREILQTALLSSNTILKEPQPIAIIKDMDAFAVEILVAFHVRSVRHRTGVLNEVFDLVYRHAKGNGLMLAPPASYVGQVGTEAKTDQSAILDLIKIVPIFTTIPEDEQKSLVSAATRRKFGTGEIIGRHATDPLSLMIVGKGVVSCDLEGQVPQTSHTRYLSPGDFFGGDELPADGSEPIRYTAATPVELYEFTRQHLASLFDRHPEILEEVTRSAGLRRNFEATPRQTIAEPKHDLIEAIRDGLRTLHLERT